MRVLFLSPVGQIGGAERVLLLAAAGVRAAGGTAHVVALGDGPLLDAVRALGGTAEVVAAPAGLAALGDSHPRGGRLGLARRAAVAAVGLPPLAARLRAAVRRFAPDLVHSNGIKTHLLGRLAVPRRVPVTWHAHDFYGLRPAAGRLLWAACGRTRAVVAISQAVAADCRAVLPGVPVAVVPNAVDTERFAPGPAADLDALAGLPPAPAGTVRVGLVATFARWKGQLALLDAAARLGDAVPVRWYVVGGPIYATAAQFTLAELRAEAARRGVADRVGFVPFQPDLAGVYNALDVVVHASTHPEPFGLTIAEAMSCGRAVVVSNAGGARELFTDETDAVGVAPGDAAGLAAAVARLAADPGLRATLGAAARRTARERFDAAGYGPKLLAVFGAVVAGRRPGEATG